MKNRVVLRLLLGFILLLPACATHKVSSQNNPESSVLVQDTLYFGMNTPKGPVTSAQWEAFLREVVTPRFPDGLTAWDAQGQWKNKDGVVGKEKSKVLLLVHPDTPQASQDIQEVIEIFEKKFHQESVMRVRSRPDVSF